MISKKEKLEGCTYLIFKAYCEVTVLETWWHHKGDTCRSGTKRGLEAGAMGVVEGEPVQPTPRRCWDRGTCLVSKTEASGPQSGLTSYTCIHSNWIAALITD